MNKYAAYANDIWVFDVIADSAEGALARAKEVNVAATRVELVNEGNRGRAA